MWLSHICTQYMQKSKYYICKYIFCNTATIGTSWLQHSFRHSHVGCTLFSLSAGGAMSLSSVRHRATGSEYSLPLVASHTHASCIMLVCRVIHCLHEGDDHHHPDNLMVELQWLTFHSVEATVARYLIKNRTTVFYMLSSMYAG